MAPDEDGATRGPLSLVSRDESLFGLVSRAARDLGLDCLRGEDPDASLVILDLDPARGGSCLDFDGEGPPLVLVLPARTGDLDFSSCVGKRVSGFLHRESPPAEAKAVLAAALGRAEEARNAALEAQRFKVLASSSPDLLIVIDEDGTYLDVFSADESLLYSKPERMRGRRISELFPPELAEPLYALIVRATRGQMGGMIEYELEVLGGKRWFEGRAAPAGMGPDGKRIAMYEARDITERKTSEAALRSALDEKNALLRELQHRVKNNLAMISSFVSLETDRLEREEDRESFERVQDRIRAMALIYDLLYRSDSVNDVDLAAYLRRLLESFKESYLGGPDAAVELADELQPARLDLKRAVPLGIVVTELLTNALKYAFPGGRRGRIELSLRIEPGEAIVAVEDDGVGLSGAAPHSESTGTGIKLTELFADQIGARLSRGPGREGRGLRCELALPLKPKEG